MTIKYIHFTAIQIKSVIKIKLSDTKKKGAHKMKNLIITILIILLMSQYMAYSNLKEDYTRIIMAIEEEIL